MPTTPTPTPSPVPPDTVGYENLIDKLANTPMETPPAVSNETVAAATSSGATEQQKAAYEKLIERLQNTPMESTTYVNPADGSPVSVDPAESITKEYLKNAPDNSHRLTDLVQYLLKLESGRQNKIIDYIPNYEELLRSAGY